MKIKKLFKVKLDLYIILLLFIILLGGFLRFYNLNWDNYQIFHPDERNIASAVTKIIFFKQLNPEFFAYGGFPVYIYRATGDLLALLTGKNIWVYDWGHVNLIGRYFSALFSTVTILFVYLLSRKFLNKKFSIISSFVFTFSVSAIQISHFATTESFLILILILLTYCCLIFYQSSSFKKAALLGIIFGTGMAAKTTGASFVLIPLLSFFLLFITQKKRKIPINILRLFSFLLFALLSFSLFSPYTFLSWNKFMESMKYESGVAWGILPVPYTHQFDKAIPYLFELYNLLWQMGPVFIFSVLGFLLLIFSMLKKRKIEYLFLIIFPLIYFLYVGSWHTKFIRYTALLLPFFSIYASYAFWVISKRFNKFGRILAIIFLTITLLWVISYMSVYIKPQTRLMASLWMYKNIPPGAKILQEHWDDGLPIRIDEEDQNQFNIEQLKIYDNEFNNKKEYYAQKLSNADYIILTTRRLHGTLINLPETFPVTSLYYKKLFSGDLGYKKVAEFSSYPNLLGIEINDDGSEESFQVYDHPKVVILKNFERLRKNDMLRKFNN